MSERIIPIIMTNAHSGLQEHEKPLATESRSSRQSTNNVFPISKFNWQPQTDMPFDVNTTQKCQPQQYQSSKIIPITIRSAQNTDQLKSEPQKEKCNKQDVKRMRSHTPTEQPPISKCAIPMTGPAQDSEQQIITDKEEKEKISEVRPNEKTIKINIVSDDNQKTSVKEENLSNYIDKCADSAAKGNIAKKIIERKESIDALNDKVTGMLDEIEIRVYKMREQAQNMEIEKETLLEMLGTLQLNQDLFRLGEGDRSDMEATMCRLVNCLKTVEVSIDTPRNEQQMRALREITGHIDNLMDQLMDNLPNNKQLLQCWINAASPDAVAGAIDQKFQAMIIECSAEDQKRIRRRLQKLWHQIEKTEFANQLNNSAPS